MLPPKAIDEFQSLWKKHYGVALSREAATARAHQVFGLIRLLAESPSEPPLEEPAQSTPSNHKIGHGSGASRLNDAPRARAASH